MSNWPTTPIGELCNLVNGRAFKPTDWSQDGVPIVRIQNLNDHDRPFNCYAGEVRAKFLIDSGDILLSWSGTPGTSFGCFVWNRGRAILNQHIFRVEVTENRVDRDYFVHAVNSQLEEMIALSHGGVGLRHITKSKLEGIRLPIPPIDEQHRIVARVQECLSRIEELRALQREVATMVGALKAAVIKAMVNPQWPRRNIASVCTDIRNGWSGKQDEGGSRVGVLRLSCVHSMVIDDEDTKPALITKATINDFGLRTGDVFLVRGNGSRHLVGRTAIALRDASAVVFNDLLIRLRPSDSLEPKFLNYIMHSSGVRSEIESAAKTAAGIWKVNQQSLGAIEIPVPDLHAQRCFVETVERALASVGEVGELVSDKAIENLAKSVLRKAFGVSS
jgi:type I restriction enzyme S subunit